MEDSITLNDVFRQHAYLITCRIQILQEFCAIDVQTLSGSLSGALRQPGGNGRSDRLMRVTIPSHARF
jgi:hypothetical protein